MAGAEEIEGESGERVGEFEEGAEAAAAEERAKGESKVGYEIAHRLDR